MTNKFENMKEESLGEDLPGVHQITGDVANATMNSIPALETPQHPMVGAEPEVDIEADRTNGEETMRALLNQMQHQTQNGQQAHTAIPTANVGTPASITNIKAHDANYYEVKGIPTRYKLYPEGTVIKARPLKVFEVKKLSSMTPDNADSIANEIINSCTTGVDVNNMYISDKIYVLLWIRANSYRDNRYVVEDTCSKCGAQVDFHFTVEDISVDPLTDETIDKIQKPVKLTNGDVVKFKYLTVADEVGIANFFDRYEDVLRKSLGYGDYDEDFKDNDIVNMSFMVESINNKRYEAIDIFKYIADLDVGNLSTLDTYAKGLAVGVRPVTSVTCDKCKGVTPRVGLMFQPDFFLPTDKSQRNS